MNGIGTRSLLWIGVGIGLSVRVGFAETQHYGRQVTRPFLKPNASVPVGRIEHLAFRRQNGGLQLLGAAADKTVRVWQFQPDAKTLSPQEVFRWPISGGQIGQSCDLHTSPDGRAALAVCPIGRSCAVYWANPAGQWTALPTVSFGSVVEWTSVGLHPQDGNRLAVAYSSAGLDARIVVWDVSGAEPRVVQTIKGGLPRIDKLRFSPEGSRLFAFDAENGQIRGWEQ